jgi:hypothetical protein
MRRNIWIWIVLGTLAMAAVGLAIFNFATPRPTSLSGDAWDYTLLPQDIPQDWKLVRQGIITPYDVEQAGLESGLPISASASLNNLVQLYYAKYEPPYFSDYLDFTVEIIRYQSQADAQTALTAENPGAEWEAVEAPQIGDESRVWHFINPNEPGVNQNLYRVDFRFLNGVASVTMIGTAEALPNADQPISYAKKILEKMRREAEPEEIQKLRAARLPDLRPLLVTQEQIAQLDPNPGNRWQFDARLVPSWTPTDQLSNPEARQLLIDLGRASGYQMFLIKVLSDTEQKLNIPEGLFQQVSAYGRAESAQVALKSMIGLEQMAESPAAPQVGDQTRAWGGLLTTTQADGSSLTLAVQEIDFQVGRYIGSIRLQSRPLDESEFQVGQAATTRLATELALALAENLRAAEQ